MNDMNILKSRLNQASSLRSICKANGDHDGYIIFDKQIDNIQSLMVKQQDKQSYIANLACQQLSR